MSSLRNAVQRRNHRERAQPTERAKWGLLEKRKDYKLRAADHKLKKRKINALKQKASERNEDEFYFGMMSASSKGGIKRAKRGEENSGGGGKVLEMEVVKLMKTQDQGYLQTMLQRTKREIERLQAEVVMGKEGVKVEAAPKRKGRIVFAEDGQIENDLGFEDEEEDDDMFDVFGDEGSDEEDQGSDDDKDKDLTPEQKLAKQRKQHALDVKRRKLAALKEQEEKLASALDQLDQQRARMNGTIGGVNKAGVKFRPRERKR